MTSRKRPPNLLIVMTDHQRGDTVLAEHPAQTPNLVAFQQQAVTFTNAWCPSPHCCPARATFHTGLYPSRHGVWNNVSNAQALSRGLRPGVRTWGEDLAAAGYDLVFGGKWHVSSDERPQQRGWRELATVSGTGFDSEAARWEQYQRLGQAQEPVGRGPGELLRPGYPPLRLYGPREEGNPHDEKVVGEAIEALGSLTAGAQPWALFVGLTGPHDPYRVPSRYVDRYRLDDIPLPPSYADALEDKPRIYRRMRRMCFGQFSERETRDAIRHFWAYCTYLDEMFGKVLQRLDASGQADNTLVLYCADHGDYCGEHGLFAKGIPCFRGAYHVPALLRWPAGVTRPGRRDDAFVSLADFGPTFLEAAGLQPPADLTGRSLLPFLRDAPPADWRDAMATQCNGVELYFTQRSMRTRDWHYVFNGFDDDELYDLQADPHEMRNLASDPAHAAVQRAMLRRLWRFAHREQDTAVNAYVTVSLAPWGPAEAFRGDIPAAEARS